MRPCDEPVTPDVGAYPPKAILKRKYVTKMTTKAPASIVQNPYVASERGPPSES
jgi:hypothetical protein